MAESSRWVLSIHDPSGSRGYQGLRAALSAKDVPALPHLIKTLIAQNRLLINMSATLTPRPGDFRFLWLRWVLVPNRELHAVPPLRHDQKFFDEPVAELVAVIAAGDVGEGSSQIAIPRLGQPVLTQNREEGT
jgi:hypothetical protein